MNLTFKHVEMKNFVSFGNVTQRLDLNNNNLHLILGENTDSDSTDHRNGTGKSSIINAISYALFGKPLVGIRLDNLINKTNERGMEVAIEFNKNGIDYRVERGRRPNKLLFYQSGTQVNEEEMETSDESQGDNRKTQEEIEKVLGINYEMFKNIVVLNTYSEPFLAMPAAQQRSFIESLLGISILSQKAEVLKEHIKATKDKITEEEYRIKGIKNANKTIEDNIVRLVEQSNEWEKKHTKEVKRMKKRLGELELVDIDKEMEIHEELKRYEENSKIFRRQEKERMKISKEKAKLKKALESLDKDIEKLESHECHACGQAVHDEQYDKMLADLNESKETLEKDINELTEEGEQIDKELESIDTEKPKESTAYEKIDDAYRHTTILENLKEALEKEKNSVNPFSDQIESLKNEGLQDIDYTKLNEYTKLKEHQDFLVKLLTSNKSFIRKEIIDRNLGYLNQRMEFYLSAVGLPHQVQFQNDLDVHITEYGRDLDFDNLSRGERTRLILALSWAFRDVYESLNGRINLLFIDELLDNGLDTSGAEAGLRILKEMNRRMKRDVFLITHREEMHGRVDSIIKVLKSNGFSTLGEGEVK